MVSFLYNGELFFAINGEHAKVLTMILLALFIIGAVLKVSLTISFSFFGCSSKMVMIFPMPAPMRS
jgi:hypothetical protein